MPYLIDGHNLIGKLPGISLQQLDDEEKLIRRVLHFCNSVQKQAEIFFDRAAPGQAGRRKYGRVTAIYVRQESTADDAIRRRLGQLKRQARNWTVVSSDRQVQAEARSWGAIVLSADEFAAIMENHQRVGSIIDEERPLREEEIADWLAAFGIDEDDAD